MAEFEVPDRSVVVGVDGSAESLAALGLAATEAFLLDTRLVVTHVWAGPQWRPGGAGERTARVDAERLLANATAWLRLNHPRVSVTGRLVLGDPAAALTTASGAAQLVVVGHRGRGSHRIGWGSVAAQLSRRSKAPLIVRIFRQHTIEPPLSAPVVVAVSPESSGRTLRFAFEVAARHNLPLAPCYVWSPSDGSGAAGDGVRGYAEGRAQAASMLSEVLDGWSARYPGVEVRPEVRHGVDVAQSLADAARQARLLVVGAGPDNPLVEILRGSVSRGVLRTADCPVAVVPEPPTPPGMPPDDTTSAQPVSVAEQFAAAEPLVPDMTALDPMASEPIGAGRATPTPAR